MSHSHNVYADACNTRVYIQQMYNYVYTNMFVTGSPDSHVTAQLHPKSGVLTASIHTTQEVYYVEPLSRHFPESHDNHMISYKHSHLKFNMTK